MSSTNATVAPAAAPRADAGNASRRLILPAALLLAALAAYSSSFSGPFVYDDLQSIPENPTLRQLWPPWEALSPPAGGATVGGRPVLNVSFALNYALGGAAVGGYHVGNLLIHVLAGLTLFGLVRRTLQLPRLAADFAGAALPVAFVTAALWTLHPLQTEAVTYMVQRAESLMGLCFLLTLYGFVAAAQAERPAKFQMLSIAACALGMGTKEVMASAPLLVLLFDRTFVAGSVGAAWRARRGYYAGLAATWLLLAWLVLGNGGNRGGSIGFGIGVSWWDHTLTQFEAVVRYLWLSAWPHPLVFDYGATWAKSTAEVLGYAAIVLPLLAGTLVALRRNHPLGFLGAWFFVILAPTSLMPGPTQMIVEHRLYLPLAAVTVLAAAGAHRAGGRRVLAGLLVAACALGVLTFRRNQDYRSDLVLWQDTVAKRPDNPVAHDNLGAALSARGHSREALAEFETTLRLDPNHPEGNINLAEALSSAGRPKEALPYLLRALPLAFNHPALQLNLGTTLDRLGRTREAIIYYERALRMKPELAEAQNNLGDVYLRLGRPDLARPRIEEALRLKPGYPEAHYNLAFVLAATGHLPEATAEFEIGHRLQPGNALARHSWATALTAAGRKTEAAAEFETALRMAPNDPSVHYDYGNLLAGSGDYTGAIARYLEALRLRPDYAEAQNNLGSALSLLGRYSEALEHYQAAVRIRPDNPGANNNLGLALARVGRLPEAVGYFEAATRLAPDFQEARENLRRAQAQLRGEPAR
jgi:tetratricopeptide (TPR) repeat protein